MNMSGDISKVIALAQSGHLEMAEKACHELCLKIENSAELWSLLGAIRVSLGKTEDAIDCTRKALNLDLECFDAHFNLAQSYAMLGKYVEAIPHYKKIADSGRANPEACNNLGRILLKTGSVAESITYLQRAVKYSPRYTAAYMNLGLAFRLLGYMKHSLNAYRTALDTNPDDQSILLAIGHALRLNGQLDDACKLYDGLLQKDPSSHAVLVGKAWALEMQGDAAESRRIVTPLVDTGALSPELATLFARLSSGAGEQEKAVALIKQLLQISGNDRNIRASLQFELGSLYEQLELFDDAFKCYKSANDLSSTDIPADKSVALMKKIKKVFTAELMQQAPHSTRASDRPIFIVGMPRSGTSLVERILSAHSDVYACGELRKIAEIAESVGRDAGESRLFPDAIMNITRQELDEAVDRYVSYIGNLESKAPHITDKMPHNFLYLGLIELMFRGVKIIHITRNPLDACLSIYFNPLSAAHEYAGNLYQIGQHYREYMSLMSHWDRVLEAPILNVCYEELVSRPDEVIRELLSFCGLQFQDQCLHSHNSKEHMNTLSYKQVRKPIYTSSIDRWKKYDQYLAPLKESLGYLAV